MSRIMKAFVFLTAVACILTSCSFSDPSSSLKELLSGGYRSQVNFTDSDGQLIFGGIFSFSDGEYRFTVNAPEDISGMELRIYGSEVSATVEGLSVPLSGSAAGKLTWLTKLLSSVGTEDDLKCEKSQLYGADCFVCRYNDADLYFSAAGLLLIERTDGTKIHFLSFEKTE